MTADKLTTVERRVLSETAGVSWGRSTSWVGASGAERRAIERLIARGLLAGTDYRDVSVTDAGRVALQEPSHGE